MRIIKVLSILAVFLPSMAQAAQFGVNTKLGQGVMNPADAALISQAGFSINRDSVSWQSVEATKGTLNWSVHNGKVFSALAAQKVQTDVLLGGHNSNYDRGLFPTSPEAVAAFARYAAFVAGKLQNQAVAFEIWNEWQSSPSANGRATTAQDYGTLFIAAANAIHAAVPGARVIAGPAAWGHQPFGKGTLKNAWTPLARRTMAVADGAVIHTYPYQHVNMSFAQAQDAMVEQVTRISTGLETVTGHPVPIYVTEFGWPEIQARGISQQVQGEQLAETARRLNALPVVKLALVYELFDSCTDSTAIGCTFGLYTHTGNRNFTAKPAVADLRAAH